MARRRRRRGGRGRKPLILLTLLGLLALTALAVYIFRLDTPFHTHLASVRPLTAESYAAPAVAPRWPAAHGPRANTTLSVSEDGFAAGGSDARPFGVEAAADAALLYAPLRTAGLREPGSDAAAVDVLLGDDTPESSQRSGGLAALRRDVAKLLEERPGRRVVVLADLEPGGPDWRMGRVGVPPLASLREWAESVDRLTVVAAVDSPPSLRADGGRSAFAAAVPVALSAEADRDGDDIVGFEEFSATLIAETRRRAEFRSGRRPSILVLSPPPRANTPIVRYPDAVAAAEPVADDTLFEKLRTLQAEFAETSDAEPLRRRTLLGHLRAAEFAFIDGDFAAAGRHLAAAAPVARVVGANDPAPIGRDEATGLSDVVAGHFAGGKIDAADLSQARAALESASEYGAVAPDVFLGRISGAARTLRAAEDARFGGCDAPPPPAADLLNALSDAARAHDRVLAAWRNLSPESPGLIQWAAEETAAGEVAEQTTWIETLSGGSPRPEAETPRGRLLAAAADCLDAAGSVRPLLDPRLPDDLQAVRDAAAEWDRTADRLDELTRVVPSETAAVLGGLSTAESPEAVAAELEALRRLLWLNAGLDRAAVVARAREAALKLNRQFPTDTPPQADAEPPEVLPFRPAAVRAAWLARWAGTFPGDNGGVDARAADLWQAATAGTPDESDLEEAAGEFSAAVRDRWRGVRRDVLDACRGDDLDPLLAGLRRADADSRRLPAYDCGRLVRSRTFPFERLAELTRFAAGLAAAERLAAGGWVEGDEDPPFAENGWYAVRAKDRLTEAADALSRYRSSSGDSASESEPLAARLDAASAAAGGDTELSVGVIESPTGVRLARADASDSLAWRVHAACGGLKGQAGVRFGGPFEGLTLAAPPTCLPVAPDAPTGSVRATAARTPTEAARATVEPTAFFRGRSAALEAAVVDLQPYRSRSVDVAAVPGTASLTVEAETKGEIVLILDRSHSMNYRLGEADGNVAAPGETSRDDVALPALQRMIDDGFAGVDERTLLTLMVYGRRIKYDGSGTRNDWYEKNVEPIPDTLLDTRDVEILKTVAADAAGRDELAKLLDRSTLGEPYGFTPLGYAVAEGLRKARGDSSVVVAVTDGVPKDLGEDAAIPYPTPQQLLRDITERKVNAALATSKADVFIVTFDLQEDEAKKLRKAFGFAGDRVSFADAADADDLRREILRRLEPPELVVSKDGQRVEGFTVGGRRDDLAPGDYELRYGKSPAKTVTLSAGDDVTVRRKGEEFVFDRVQLGQRKFRLAVDGDWDGPTLVRRAASPLKAGRRTVELLLDREELDRFIRRPDWIDFSVTVDEEEWLPGGVEVTHVEGRGVPAYRVVFDSPPDRAARITVRLGDMPTPSAVVDARRDRKEVASVGGSRVEVTRDGDAVSLGVFPKESASDDAPTPGGLRFRLGVREGGGTFRAVRARLERTLDEDGRVRATLTAAEPLPENAAVAVFTEDAVHETTRSVVVPVD